MKNWVDSTASACAEVMRRDGKHRRGNRHLQHLVAMAVVCLNIGFYVGAFVGGNHWEAHWHGEIIKHGHARHHPETGKFEWTTPEIEVRNRRP